MSARTGRSILRALYEPALKGIATAGKILVADANKNITGLTLTSPTITGATITGTVPVVPINAGAALTAPAGNQKINLNTAAGSVVTLPAATGSGATYIFSVTATTTSNAHKILAASSADFLNGIAVGFTGSTAKVFASAAATNHSIQMPFAGTQPSGGFIGDQIEFIDVAANLWQVSMTYQAGTTPTTPFSSSTT